MHGHKHAMEPRGCHIPWGVRALVQPAYHAASQDLRATVKCGASHPLPVVVEQARVLVRSYCAQARGGTLYILTILYTQVPDLTREWLWRVRIKELRGT